MRARAGLLPADIVTSKGCPSAAQATASSAPMLPLVISTTGCARLEPAIRARRQQDGLGGAVLHAAAGLQELGLGDQPARRRRGSGPTRSGRVSYQIQRGGREHVRSAHGRRGGPASRTEIVGNASAGVSLAAPRRPRFDPRHRRRVQPGQQIQRAQVSRSCATPDAPSSTVLTSGLRNAHAIASCARVAPNSSATSRARGGCIASWRSA